MTETVLACPVPSCPVMPFPILYQLPFPVLCPVLPNASDQCMIICDMTSTLSDRTRPA